jgi:flagellar protein FlaG
VFDLDISVLKNPIDFVDSSFVSKATPLVQPVGNAIAIDDGAVEEFTPPSDDILNKKPIDIQELAKMTEVMNKFVKAMETNIQFKIHKETNQLIVQVVDQANHKVLKEFPLSDFLDTIAAIRDYVGILLDKKA